MTTLASRRFRRQTGSTLTGFIIGLIIGLGIAVTVALVINKGAMPFTDKSGKLGKLAEPTAGQVADPNKPLYGNKDAARLANKEITEKHKAAADDPLGAAVAAMGAAGAAVDAKAAEPKPAAAAAPAPAAATAADNPEDKVTYYLQAGAFREISDAENTRAKLALLGFEAEISATTKADTGLLHRVRVGPYAQVEALNKAKAKLSDSGILVAVVRNQN